MSDNCWCGQDYAKLRCFEMNTVDDQYNCYKDVFSQYDKSSSMSSSNMSSSSSSSMSPSSSSSMPASSSMAPSSSSGMTPSTSSSSMPASSTMPASTSAVGSGYYSFR